MFFVTSELNKKTKRAKEDWLLLHEWALGNFPISSSESIKINSNPQLRTFRFRSRSLSARWAHTHTHKPPPQRETKKETPSAARLIKFIWLLLKIFSGKFNIKVDLRDLAYCSLFSRRRVFLRERRLPCTFIYTQRNNLAAPLHPVGRALCTSI